jgi:NAD dependent epimerase/dehydratase family enzyme
LIGAIHHAALTEELSGPVNAVAPNPVTNRELVKTLGCVLGRPAVVPMPALAARLAFGQAADELLLASTRVSCDRLTDAGFAFHHPDLEETLRSLLGRRKVS